MGNEFSQPNVGTAMLNTPVSNPMNTPVSNPVSTSNVVNLDGSTTPVAAPIKSTSTPVVAANSASSIPVKPVTNPFPLNIMSSNYGNHLVDSKGMSLYVYTLDNANTSNCSGDCLTRWPPLLINSNFAPLAASGINASAFGSTVRADGTKQLTFNKWPLYYYYLDKNPGDTNGQTTKGLWYLVAPCGKILITPLVAANQPNNSSAKTIENYLAQYPDYAAYLNWKHSLGYDDYKRYHTFSRWRDYARVNNYDWRDGSNYHNWYKNYKYGKDLHNHYNRWRRNWSSDDYDNWRHYSSWRY